MVLTLTFCFLESSWRTLRADSSSLNDAVVVLGLKGRSPFVRVRRFISL